MQASEDLYEVLQVSPNADPEVIEAAYRRLSLKYHPDRNADDAAATRRMQAINTAYDRLRDPARRAAYDCARQAGRQRPPSGRPPVARPAPSRPPSSTAPPPPPRPASPAPPPRADPSPRTSARPPKRGRRSVVSRIASFVLGLFGLIFEKLWAVLKVAFAFVLAVAVFGSVVFLLWSAGSWIISSIEAVLLNWLFGR